MVGFGRPPRGFGSGFGSNPAAMDKAMAQKATASDDSPIPGYMYGEFAKQTLASYEACRQLEEYLLKRVVNKNPNVKLKSLLIMKHVALKGRPDFKRDLMRSLCPIKDCLQFSGPPDPLRGDEVYVKIRATAPRSFVMRCSSRCTSNSLPSSIRAFI